MSAHPVLNGNQQTTSDTTRTKKPRTSPRASVNRSSKKTRVTMMLPATVNRKLDLYCAALGPKAKKNEIATQALIAYLEKNKNEVSRRVAEAMEA